MLPESDVAMLPEADFENCIVTRHLLYFPSFPTFVELASGVFALAIDYLVLLVPTQSSDLKTLQGYYNAMQVMPKYNYKQDYLVIESSILLWHPDLT
ncbi:predicted protein [Lichtheimia corymbifera JMRC:FSU:9682]|uniref:Uncharacterized protein n=1 Tax=Lichtheimia corymbifera JMRC:FSU:9682 TaxID=1263082 RepID=A0A068S4F1_9FUNG|nr:predicted protein [Lichtheimia corymbifera JMRC:FSU:9682]